MKIQNKPPRVLGLTGGIGSGKSLVAKTFLKYGVPTLDADHVARHLREPGQPGHTAILTRFGTVDRTELRRLISESAEAKKDLEAILHPLIAEKGVEMLTDLAKAHPHAPFLLYEATLLIEAGRAKDFEGLIVVTAPLEDRITRVMTRDQISKEAALLLIQTQNSDEFRLKHAQYVIKNAGSTLDLEEEVRKVLDQIISS